MENVFELVGVHQYDFKDKEGKQVKGTKIHFIMDPSDVQKTNGFRGKVCGTQNFPAGSSIPSQLTCGQFYEFLFGYSKGKPIVTGFRAVNIK